MCRYNKWISEQALNAAFWTLVIFFSVSIVFSYLEWLPEVYDLTCLMIGFCLSLSALMCSSQILSLFGLISNWSQFTRFCAGISIVLFLPCVLLISTQVKDMS